MQAPTLRRPSRIERERGALVAHRAALRGSRLPPPHEAPKGTFIHGFLLPFSLIAATLRDAHLRGPYVRVAVVRGLLVLLVGIVAVAKGDGARRDRPERARGGLVVEPGPKGNPLHVNVPGLRVDIDGEGESASVSVLGQSVPVATKRRHAKATGEDTAASSPPPSVAGRFWDGARHGWAWLLALVTVLSATEGILVFFSRRWDDWLSFHASRLAAIRPEDETPKTPKVALDLRWLYRKLRRRLRGYVVFAAGVPALALLRLVPTAGPWLFSLAVTLWGWYWLGVFSAAKSAHAWADEETALSPAPIRTLERGTARGVVLAPLRWYARLWAKITRGVNPAATTFERSPAAFLGLALARVVLSMPGLYLLARPIVPVAAGRLCAEADPADRFAAAEPPEPAALPPP
jgi:hypothetical protein